MNKLKLVGLAALLALGGCMTKGQIKKVVVTEQKKCDEQVKFNVNVAQSLVIQDCNSYIDDQTSQWEVLFCTHDKKLADKLTKAGIKTEYHKGCLAVLKAPKWKVN